MEYPETLDEITKLGRNLTEAVSYYEEAIKIVEAAFNALTQIMVDGRLLPYQRQQAERYRGLAIRQLACLLSDLQTSDHLSNMKEAETAIYNMTTFMRTSTSFPPTNGGNSDAKDKS